MNPELPKSIRSVLAQKESLTAHPSADLLTAFAEHRLTAGENERVADHLAGCSECREVLFLASDVVEQPTADTERAAKVGLRPRPRWMPKLAWVASGVVGIAIVAGVVLQQYLARERSEMKVAQVAQVAPPQVAPQPVLIAPSPDTSYVATIAPKTAKPTHSAKAKPSEAGKVSHQASDMAAMKPPPPNMPESPAVAGAPQPNPANQPSGSVIAGAASSFDVGGPTQNSFAERPEASKAQSFASAQLQGAPMGLMRKSAAIKTWRVTAEGHLEHLSQTGWTGVLTDQPVKFRVVAASPNDVWAGGSHGELFHSEDDGAHWNEIALPIPPDGKNDPVVTIHFVDLQHGIVVTGSGAPYTTSDGGKSWRRE
jgi:Photosynthesis system II assembly factor YCF48/Putative zinc-finger